MLRSSAVVYKVNQDEIDVGRPERTAALANVIHNLVKYAKRARGPRRGSATGLPRTEKVARRQLTRFRPPLIRTAGPVRW